ncbi:hypothetical protein AAVH_32997 [Aphelenchoides avenae]|nr:hypothetical protein AAVH_32997 [Aphelenchus avenae]
MRLLLFLLLLAPVVLAEGWHELQVNGSLTCPPHRTLDIWYFKVSLVRQPKLGAGGKLEVVDNKSVMEGSSFSLRSPGIGPLTPIGFYNYFLKVDGPSLCGSLPKSIPLDWSKRRIDLGVVDLTKIH